MREMISILLLAYWTILVAELIGDRSILAVTSLALRFRPLPVYSGIAVGFMAKMLGAVLLAKLLTLLPVGWTSAISAATFFTTAVSIAFRRQAEGTETERRRPWHAAAIVSFSTIFFAEWADSGQISAAALAARYDAPAVVWLAGSLALCTKGALAMKLGLGLRRRVPERLARILSITSCSVLGLACLVELLMR